MDGAADGASSEGGDGPEELDLWTARWRLSDRPMMWWVDEDVRLTLDRKETLDLWTKQTELDAEWMALESAGETRVSFHDSAPTVHVYDVPERFACAPPAVPHVPAPLRHSAFSVYRSDVWVSPPTTKHAMVSVAKDFAHLKRTDAAAHAALDDRARRLNEKLDAPAAS
mmetsp:Transcript_3355/g.10150  ORF Transcript_3355/g.10150 Transcript_3355/m.10150 type:complete len:169 (+) Transcript_3355:190-696(+)